MNRHQQLLYLLRVVLLLLLLNLLEALSNVAVTPTEEELRSIAASSFLEKLRALQACKLTQGATGPGRLSN
jgi:hypothetical protein